MHYLFCPQGSSIKCLAGRLTMKRRVSPFLKISFKGNSLPCLLPGSQKLLLRKSSSPLVHIPLFGVSLFPRSGKKKYKLAEGSRKNEINVPLGIAQRHD